MQEFMDRALKERIIGAVVLVVFAVLVVPVFLDGPSDHASEISEAITLPGQNGTSNKTQRIVLNRDRTEPVPATLPTPDAIEAADGNSAEPDKPDAGAGTSESPPQGDIVAVVTEPRAQADSPPEEPLVADDGASAVRAAVETESATGMWAVQLGSFSNKQNAERLAADLRKSGYAAFLSQLNSGDKPLHRVRVGPQKDRADAESMATKLAGAGHKGQVVPHP